MSKPLVSYHKARFIIAIIVGASAAAAVNAAIKNNVIPNNTYSKIVLGIGAFAISSMAGDRARNWAKKEMDDYRATYLDIKSAVQEASA